MMQSGYSVKRYSEVPKTITLTRDRIFQLRFCRSLMLIRDVRRSGHWFLRGVTFWSIRSSGLLRWFCVTGAALRMTWPHFSVAGAVLWTDGVAKLQNALVRGCQLCTQLSIFEGSLTELLRFWCCQLRKRRKSRRMWCCQVQKLRKSRRIAAFFMLSSSKTEEVSQNRCVFKLADRQIVERLDNYNCNYNYKYHYTALLLQLQVQIYYATLDKTNCTTVH